MRVALVSSVGECGIAEHSDMLKEYVSKADRTIEFVQDSTWLDPDDYGRWYQQSLALFRTVDVLHLNYHRGLHSRWTPEELTTRGSLKNKPTVITFHDTYETQPDSLPWDLLDACDAMIVHEPCDLVSGPIPRSTPAQETTAVVNRRKVHYWRQGVPQPEGFINEKTREYYIRPMVGTCGFAFPWKGFELLCDAARLAGWGVFIAAHNATDDQVYDWTQRNPWVHVCREYLDTPRLIGALAGCDATAFLYSCANSGTSGAIRLGIAAGKPLLAMKGCRQFRDLEEDPLIWTTGSVADVADALESCLATGGRFDGGIIKLRERDSWEHLGKKYAHLYRELVK